MRAKATVLVLALVVSSPALTAAQATSAEDITSEDISGVLAIMGRSIDHQLKVVDIGIGNVAVGILHRTGDNDSDGAHNGIIHSELSEVYYILSGGGTLLTGGEISNPSEVDMDPVVGPTFSADSRNGRIRDVSAGDIVVIPEGVLHVWTLIPDQVTSLSIRPDPHGVLPAGYVHPEIE